MASKKNVEGKVKDHQEKGKDAGNGRAGYPTTKIDERTQSNTHRSNTSRKGSPSSDTLTFQIVVQLLRAGQRVAMDFSFVDEGEREGSQHQPWETWQLFSSCS